MKIVNFVPALPWNGGPSCNGHAGDGEKDAVATIKCCMGQQG